MSYVVYQTYNLMLVGEQWKLVNLVVASSEQISTTQNIYGTIDQNIKTSIGFL